MLDCENIDIIFADSVCSAGGRGNVLSGSSVTHRLLASCSQSPPVRAGAMTPALDWKRILSDVPIEPSLLTSLTSPPPPPCPD